MVFSFITRQCPCQVTFTEKTKAADTLYCCCPKSDLLVPCVHVTIRLLFKFNMLQLFTNTVICFVLHEHVSAVFQLNVCQTSTMMSKMVEPTSQLSRCVMDEQTRWVRQNQRLPKLHYNEDESQTNVITVIRLNPWTDKVSQKKI